MKKLTKKEKLIVKELVTLFKKYKDLGSIKLAEIIRDTFLYEG